MWSPRSVRSSIPDEVARSSSRSEIGVLAGCRGRNPILPAGRRRYGLLLRTITRICFLLSNHRAGLDGLAAAVAEHADHGLVREALGHLADAFASVDHVGPRAVADFLELEPGTDEYDRVRQDAYQRVRFILERRPGAGV